jgi:prepilin-type N-terminal cleavage/methylation domain-containing protein
MNKTIFDTNQTKAGLGFTLVEVLVVVAIIGILSAIIYPNFESSRQNSRDQIRKAGLKELQLALESYKAQNGRYPSEHCDNQRPLVPGSWDGDLFWSGVGRHNGDEGMFNPEGYNRLCVVYALGLVPNFIQSLPIDPKDEQVYNLGFFYRVSEFGDSYKAMVYEAVETDFITSYDDEFARCPRQDPTPGNPCSGPRPPERVYAVYSPGAEFW